MSYHCDLDYSVQIAIVQTIAHREPVYAATPAEPTPSQRALIERNIRIQRATAVALVDATEECLAWSRSALGNVERFLHLLPSYMPDTEPYVSYAGSICFDWDENPKNQLSLMLQDKNRISFAAYFSGEKLNGAFDFSPLGLPREIVLAAERWHERNRAIRA